MSKPTKAIVLAGGKGTRLYPLTNVASKQLLPLYNKPMIYYPLTTVMLAGARDILLISTAHDIPRFESLLGDGGQWGLSISYKVQDEPRGIAEAFILGDEFIGDDQSMLILGDNVFYGRLDFLRDAVAKNSGNATVFAYPVSDPRQYGVVEFGPDNRVLSLEEKPAVPKSRWAVPGIYVYPPGVAAKARALKPSPRGELEITDLNKVYLSEGTLKAQPMGRGIAWFDTGTPRSLLDAANFIEAIESRQGLSIGSPEEAAVRMGYIDQAGLERCLGSIPSSPYREYIERVASETDPRRFHQGD